MRNSARSPVQHGSGSGTVSVRHVRFWLACQEHNRGYSPAKPPSNFSATQFPVLENEKVELNDPQCASTDLLSASTEASLGSGLLLWKQIP